MIVREKKLMVVILFVVLMLIPIGISFALQSQITTASTNVQTSQKNSFITNTTRDRNSVAGPTFNTQQTSQEETTLIKIDFPLSFTSNTLGNFIGNSSLELAGISYLDGRVYFFDFYRKKVIYINNDTYSSQQAYNGVILTTANLDADSYDEVVYLNITGWLFLIDNDATLINKIDLGIPDTIYSDDVLFFKAIDLDNDGYDDPIVSISTSADVFVFVIDGFTHSLVGNISISNPYAITGITVGEFNSNTGLEIGISYVNGTITLYDKTLTSLFSNTLSDVPYNIVTISNSSWHFDALVSCFYTPTYHVSVLNATTLTPMGYAADVNFDRSIRPVIGDFDADNSPEVAIATLGYGLAIFDLNENTTTNEFLLFSNPAISLTTGKITADNTDDIVISSSDMAFVFKGQQGNTQIKLLREIDEPSYIYNVEIAQYDVALKDVFVTTWFSLYVYRSDSTPPRISDVKTYPIRPTIEDPFFSISALINDETPVSDAVLIYNFTTAEGVTTETNVQVGLAPESHASSVYVAYFTNLISGEYTFKILARDAYDNVIIDDNNGALYTVTIYSKILFSKQLQTDIIEAKKSLAVGNIDGDAFSDVAVALNKNITIVFGDNTIITPIKYNDVFKPSVYLEEIDTTPGDDIIFHFGNQTTSRDNINIYTGSTFSLFRKYVFNHDVTHIVIGDVNNDGLNELIVVEQINVTTSRLFVITPQTNTTLKDILVDKVKDIKIYNITQNDPDIVILTLDNTLTSFNVTVLTGENNLQKLFSYTNTTSGVISFAKVYYDRFIQSSDKQLLVVVSSGGSRVYLINATTGALIEDQGITYTTGFVVLDLNFDGIKEFAYLGYDNSIIFSRIGETILPGSGNILLPSDPYKVFYTNFDEDMHPDLVYVLNDRIAIYSIYSDRYEEVTFSYRLLAGAEIGNFFELPFNDICILSSNGLLEKFVNINIFYRANVDVTLKQTEILQGDTIDIKVNVNNAFGDPISTSNIVGEIYFNNSVIVSSSFTSLENGTYLLTLAATNLPIGIYELQIITSDAYYGTYLNTYGITVKGEINGLISIPESVRLGKYLLANVTLIDSYGFPVFNASVEITLGNGTYEPIVVRKNSYLFRIPTENLSIGEKIITIEAFHPLAIKPLSVDMPVALIGDPVVTFEAEGINRPPVVQGETIHIKLNVYDNYMHPVSGCTIVAYLFGIPYTFTDLGNGTYIALISTLNIPGGKHKIFFELSHNYLFGGSAVANITIISKPVLTYVISPPRIEQGSTMNITMQLTDIFGYPIKGANIIVEFRGRTYEAINVFNNTYFVSIDVGNIRYGPQQLNITITGENIETQSLSELKVFIYPKIPRLDLSPSALLTLLVISIGASIAGLMLYYIVSARLVRSFTIDEQGRLIMDFKPLDRIYGLFTALMFLTLGAATVLYIRGLYELAVSTLGLALLEILLIYGIWLYRDAAYTLVSEKMPILRMLLGFWHLILAPVIIFGIFWWGEKIDWFAFYILKDTVRVGPIIIPSIYISLMGTYVTSIIVLTFNIYLNSRRYKNRFAEMRAGGTPENVINDEKIIQLDRMSSSIRIKFFVFLAILGASLVSTASPLLQYYQLGLVVILPLIFIIVIPYIISRILKFLGFAKRVTRRLPTLPIRQ